jgi:hypothetical protein
MKDSLRRNIKEITNAPVGTIANLQDNAGQLGIGPHLTRIDAATPLVFPPLVPVVTHIPTMFRKFENASEAFKTLIERNTKSITGVDFGYDLEDASGYTLADGQEALMPTKKKRTPVSPSMVFPEVNGNLVWNFLNFWTSLICDADTHHSRLGALLGDEPLDPFVYSYFSADIMLIQFDITMKPENIIDGFFLTCVSPKTTGQFGLQKEIGTSQVQERSIDFRAIMQHNENTYNAAVAIASILNLHKANFDWALPIATEIEEEAQNLGVQAEIENIVKEFKTAT